MSHVQPPTSSSSSSSSSSSNTSKGEKGIRGYLDDLPTPMFQRTSTTSSNGGRNGGREGVRGNARGRGRAGSDESLSPTTLLAQLHRHSIVATSMREKEREREKEEKKRTRRHTARNAGEEKGGKLTSEAPRRQGAVASSLLSSDSDFDTSSSSDVSSHLTDDDDEGEDGGGSDGESWSSYDSEEERRLAQEEWDEGIRQLQQTVQVFLLPFFGRWMGRKCSYWAFARYLHFGRLSSAYFKLDWLVGPFDHSRSRSVSASA